MQISPPVVPDRRVSPLMAAKVYYLWSPVLGSWHVPGFKKYCMEEMSNSKELIMTCVLFNVTIM
jgi:uncharacterized membrane protein (DUF4010 family)